MKAVSITGSKGKIVAEFFGRWVADDFKIVAPLPVSTTEEMEVGKVRSIIVNEEVVAGRDYSGLRS